MARKTPTPPDSNLTFEQAFAQLEEIVAKLESAELSLDESLALFERGQALAAHCAKLLDAAELKVKQLAPGGKLEEFEPPEE
jgi:exodeoxyribonuclease VII small subunit